jgi:heme/copper-type cytochrome/quinol oxidase subunit 1
MVLATLIRLELAYPGVGIFAGDSLQYLSMVTAHGVIMVFFMIIPLLFGAFANFLLPTQLGVHDVAFPRLNSAAFWFLPGGLLMLCQLVCVDRRYQRMNCFNIREIQSILKRKFFTDLINNHDHHNLLDKTTIGLRFKTNSINSINSNMFIFFNYGIEFTSKIRKNVYNIDLFSLNDNNLNNFLYNLTTFFLNVKIFSLFNNVYIYSNFNFSAFTLFFKNFYLNAHLFLNNVVNFNLVELNNAFIFLFNIQNYVLLLKVLSNYLFNISNIFNYLYLLVNVNFFLFYIYFFNNFYHYYLSFFNLKFALSSFNFNLFYLFSTDSINVYEFFFVVKILEILNVFNMYSHSFNMYNSFYFLNQLVNSFFNAIINFYKVLSNNFFINNIANSYNLDLVNKEVIYNKNIIDVTFKDKNYFFNNNFYSQLNYNSYYAYLYIFFYFILNIPAYFFNIVSNLFNIKILFMYVNEINNIFINWFLPMFFNNNVFYWFFKNINFIFYNVNLKKNIIESVNLSLSDVLNFSFFHILGQFANTAYYLYFLLVSLSNLVFKYLFNVLTLHTYLFFNYQTFFVFNKMYDLVFVNNYFNTTNKNIKDSFSSNFFFTLDNENSNKYNNEEISNNFRYQRFYNPVFKYDYKSGDYFPKLYKELYAHLFSSINDITGGLRQSPWFLSNTYMESFSYTFNNYFNNVTQTSAISNYNVYTRNEVRLSNTDAFYNFFYILYTNNTIINKRWISLNSLNQKFYKMFNTSSMQQRIYSNWRQLKFTREAWRCKLLSARHQKTMYKRYVNEDGVFWSIERNAKDLLPGWAMITPFSARVRFTAVGKTDIGLMGVLLVLNSSIISGANYLVTYRYISTLNNRKMRDARAFFTEGVLVASWMMIAANPMLAIGIIMLLSDRHWQTSFFDYSGGGDTVLFQHMFWFFGHPEVYVIMIPIFGFANTILSYYLRKRISARASLMYSLYTIAFLGFFVWGHHMYMVGLAHTTRMLFSTLTVMISVPAATKLMHWSVTLVNSSFSVELPLAFIFSFIFFFVSGGISGMAVAHTGMDILFHDTFYVIGHFHVLLAGSGMFGALGAFYFYFPAIFGVKYSRIYAYLHYIYFFIGQLTTVIPMFWLGYSGMPRRVLDYPASMGGWHSIVSAGHLLIVAGFISFFIMIFDSLRQAKAVIRSTFGVNRYNTRLNFYLYEVSRLTFVQQKSWFLYKFLFNNSIKLNNKNFSNYENYETVLFSYVFLKK